MKLSSAALSKKRVLGSGALAAIAAGFCAIAAAQPAPPPRPQAAAMPGTAEAYQCLLRQGPKGCEKMFVGSASPAAQPWVWENNRRDFNRGPFVSGGYWGKADQANIFDSAILTHQPTNMMDIYDAKFAHEEWTFYIGPARDDGKINALAIRFYGPHDLNQLHGH